MLITNACIIYLQPTEIKYLSISNTNILLCEFVEQQSVSHVLIKLNDNIRNAVKKCQISNWLKFIRNLKISLKRNYNFEINIYREKE